MQSQPLVDSRRSSPRPQTRPSAIENGLSAHRALRNIGSLYGYRRRPFLILDCLQSAETMILRLAYPHPEYTQFGTPPTLTPRCWRASGSRMDRGARRARPRLRPPGGPYVPEGVRSAVGTDLEARRVVRHGERRQVNPSPGALADYQVFPLRPPVPGAAHTLAGSRSRTRWQAWIKSQ